MSVLSQSDIDDAERALSADARSPWYVETFLAIGGWIAGLLAAGAIFAFVAMLFSDLKNMKAAAGVALAIGLLFVFFGTRVGKGRRTDFGRHFAIALIAAGLTAAVAGFWYLAWSLLDAIHVVEEGARPETREIAFSGMAASLFLIAAGAFAARAVKDGILTFLTVSAWFWIVAASIAILREETSVARAAFELFPPAAALIGLFLFTQPIGRRVHAAAGAALMIAPMIFFETLRGGMGLFGVDPLESGRLSSAVFAAGAVYCLALIRDRYRLAGILAATALITAGMWFLTDAGRVAMLLLLAGFAANHRGLAAVGVAALAWFVGKFYHDLSMTLLAKSAILGGLGFATLAGALALKGVSRTAAPLGESGAAPPTRRALIGTLAFGALLLGALGFVNNLAAKLDRAFSDARTIFLPLGPVDPRSLIQGDYMVLNFRETIYPPFESITALPDRGEVFLRLDADGVAAFSRLAGPADAPGTDEIRVEYLMSGGAIRYCPTSFFFQEGEADAFAAARFAVVLVAPDGQTRLVELADENRKVIAPMKSPEQR